jgi:hypothetical protein
VVLKAPLPEKNEHDTPRLGDAPLRVRTTALRRFALATVALALAASPAAAEVMDKEPSLQGLWLWAVAGSLVGYAACRLRGWLLPLVLPVAAFLPLVAVLESHDRYVGPAMRHEAGQTYVVQAHVLLVLILTSHLAGLAARLRARQRALHQRPEP